MAAPAYNERSYRAFKQHLALNHVACWYHGCDNRATSPDHDPPLSAHTHIPGSGCCVLRPSCKPHQDKQGAAIRNAKSSSGYGWP